MLLSTHAYVFCVFQEQGRGAEETKSEKDDAKSEASDVKLYPDPIPNPVQGPTFREFSKPKPNAQANANSSPDMGEDYQQNSLLGSTKYSRTSPLSQK